MEIPDLRSDKIRSLYYLLWAFLSKIGFLFQSPLQCRAPWLADEAVHAVRAAPDLT